MNPEVLIELRFTRKSVSCLSARCVELSLWNSLSNNLQNRNLDEKLKLLPYDINTSNLINKITVITDVDKISAFKTLYGNVMNSDIDVLKILFSANDGSWAPEIYNDEIVATDTIENDDDIESVPIHREIMTVDAMVERLDNQQQTINNSIFDIILHDETVGETEDVVTDSN